MQRPPDTPTRRKKPRLYEITVTDTNIVGCPEYAHFLARAQYEAAARPAEPGSDDNDPLDKKDSLFTTRMVNDDDLQEVGNDYSDCPEGNNLSVFSDEGSKDGLLLGVPPSNFMFGDDGTAAPPEAALAGGDPL